MAEKSKVKQDFFLVRFFRSKSLLFTVSVTLIVSGIFCSAIYVFAVYPTTTYSPGDTLDPACAPGASNCTITPPITANQTITLSGVLSGSGTTGITVSAASGYYIPTTTDQSTWNSGLSNPMSAVGDMIYGGTGGTPTRLVVGSSGQILQGGTNPAWSTATYPATTTANQILYSTATNTIGAGAGLTFDGATLKVTGTTGVAQERLAYDATNYADMTVGATGSLTIAATTATTGGDIIFTPGTTGNPQLLSDSGTMILGSSKTAGNEENLSLDFETTANKVAIASSTGVTDISWTGSLTMGGSTTGTLVTRVAVSAPTESDANGSIVVDSGDSGRIYFRYGGAWHYVAQTAGFQIPNFETSDPISGEAINEGDIVLGMINQTLEDGALHGIWVKWSSVKEQLLAEARGELSSSGTWGSDTVQGVDTTPFLDKVTNALVSLGISVKDGIVNIKDLAVERSSTDIARIKKIEMVDETTGEVYCTWIKNGEWTKVKGECSSMEATVAASQTTLSTFASASTEVNQQVKEVVQQARQVTEQAQEATQTAQQIVQESTDAAQQAATTAADQAASQATQQIVQQTTDVIQEVMQEAADQAASSVKEQIQEQVEMVIQEQLQIPAESAVPESTLEVQPSAPTETPADITLSTPLYKLTASLSDAVIQFAGWLYAQFCNGIKNSTASLTQTTSAVFTQSVSASAKVEQGVNLVKQKTLMNEFNILIDGILDPVKDFLWK